MDPETGRRLEREAARERMVRAGIAALPAFVARVEQALEALEPRQRKLIEMRWWLWRLQRRFAILVINQRQILAKFLQRSSLPYRQADEMLRHYQSLNAFYRIKREGVEDRQPYLRGMARLEAAFKEAKLRPPGR